MEKDSRGEGLVMRAASLVRRAVSGWAKEEHSGAKEEEEEKRGHPEAKEVVGRIVSQASVTIARRKGTGYETVKRRLRT